MSFYHLELRQFPHVARRFNQSEQQVLALAKPWIGEEWIEEAERKWNMNEAKLTILEGPELSMADLAMGRGWRNAQRRSEDVTERVLDAFRKPDRRAASDASTSGGGEPVANGAGDLPGAVGAAPDVALLADSLALELLALLDEGPVTPTRVWRLAQERLVGRSLGEALTLADRAVRSLVARRLIVLLAATPSANGTALSDEQVETALGTVDVWGGGGSSPVVIARKG